MCSHVYLLVLDVLCFFLFFKQKTAYEMRISDWSSDVCSSDLQDIPKLRYMPISPGSRGRNQPPPTSGNNPIAVSGMANISRSVAMRCEIGRASCRERVCQYV